MHSSEPSRGIPRQAWFAALMGLALLGLVATILLGWNPQPPAGRRAEAVARRNAPRSNASRLRGETEDAAGTAGAETADADTAPGTQTATPGADAGAPLGPTAVVLPPLQLPTVEASTNPGAADLGQEPEDDRGAASGPTAVVLPPLEPTFAATPEPTLAPTPTVPRTPFPPQPRTFVDHYWLERPIGPGGMQRADRFYPYASRGDGTYPAHHGVEFVNPYGTAALAVGDGTIRVAGEDELQVYGARDGFYGLLVLLELAQTLDGQPLYAVYGHLSEVAVRPGQTVGEGEVLGYVGMSGIAEGPHLHFEVRAGSDDYRRTANPDLWLRPLPDHGTLAGELVSSDGQPVPDARLVLYRAGSTTPYRFFTSYPLGGVNADPAWGENLCAGDVPAGQWTLQVWHRGAATVRDVTIEAGKTTWVSIRVG